MAALHVSHMALSCKNIPAIERFYTRYFGFRRARVVAMDGLEQVVFLKREDLYLELFRVTKEAPVPPAGGAGPEYPGWRHLAFQVDNLDATLAEMGTNIQIALGPISFASIIPGWRSVWISDPEGNSIEISQGFVDQEQPPPLPL